MTRIFVDAMVIMEYTSFDSYNWWAHPELKDTAIELVFTKPIIEELDRNKDHNPRGSVKKRCRSVLSKLHDLVDSESPGPSKVTEALFISVDLTRFVSQAPLNNDERLLEHAIRSEGAKYIVSNDYTVLLGAKQKKIPTLRPLESERIADEEQSELDSLKKELSEYKNKLPLFSISSSTLPASRDRVEFENTCDDIIREFKSKANIYIEQPPKENPINMIGGSPNFWFMQRGITRDEYENTLRDTDHALRLCSTLSKEWARRSYLTIEITNKGNTLATSINLKCKFPASLEISIPEGIDFPTIPRLPSRFDIWRDSRAYRGALIDQVKPRPLQINGQVVSLAIGELQHYSSYKFTLAVKSKTRVEGQLGFNTNIISNEIPSMVNINTTLEVVLSESLVCPRLSEISIKQLKSHLGIL